jgi:hypothetical protein
MIPLSSQSLHLGSRRIRGLTSAGPGTALIHTWTGLVTQSKRLTERGSVAMSAHPLSIMLCALGLQFPYSTLPLSSITARGEIVVRRPAMRGLVLVGAVRGAGWEATAAP